MSKIKSILVLVVVIIFSCKKESVHISYKPAPIEIKYSMTLSNDTITRYSIYHNNQLISTKHYYFNNSSVDLISYNSYGKLIGTIHFLIDTNSLAYQSIDSTFSDNGLFLKVSISTMEYENGYLTKMNIDTGKVILKYSISDGNVISKTQSYPDWKSGCTDYFSSSLYSTPVDVLDFKNGFQGNSNKNLPSQVSWNNGCPC